MSPADQAIILVALAETRRELNNTRILFRGMGAPQSLINFFEETIQNINKATNDLTNVPPQTFTEAIGLGEDKP